MGMLDSLLGSDSGGDHGSSERRDGDGGMSVTQFYFVGNEIDSDPLKEATMILRWGPPTAGGGDSWDWGVVKCNERIKADMDMDIHICVYKSGSVIYAGEAYRSLMAWLLTGEEMEKLTNDSDVMYSLPFPDALRGQTLPEGTDWGSEELQSLLLPFEIST